MLKTLKRKIALGAVAAVGAAGLVTIAAPAANAAAYAPTGITASVVARTGTDAFITYTATGASTYTDSITVWAQVLSAPAGATGRYAAYGTVMNPLSRADSQTASLGITAGTSTARTISLGAPDGSNVLAAGAYSMIVWTADSASATSTSPSASDASTTVSFTAAGAPASITLGASSGSSIVGDSGTVGAQTTITATVKDAAGVTTLLKSTESLQAKSGLAGWVTATSGSTTASKAANVALTALNNGTYKAFVGNNTAASDTITFSGGGLLSGAGLTASYALTTFAAVTSGDTVTVGSTLAGVSKASGSYTATASATTYTSAGSLFASSVTGKSITFNYNAGAANAAGTALATIVAGAGGLPTGVTAGTTKLTLSSTGTATFTVAATAAAAASGYVVTIGGVAMTVTYGTPVATKVAVTSPDQLSITAVVGGKTTISAKVTDQYGDSVAGALVSFIAPAAMRNATGNVLLSSSNSDASGVASYTLTDASTSTTVLTDKVNVSAIAVGLAAPIFAAGAGAVTVSTEATNNPVTINYATSVTPATVTVGLPATGTVTNTTTCTATAPCLAIDTAATWTATLKSSTGSVLASGIAVTWTITGGYAASLISYTTSGVASLAVSPSSAGPVTVTATASGISGSNAALTGTSSATTNARTIALDAATYAVTGGSVKRVNATVKDRYGNVMPGVAVTFAFTTGAGRFAGGALSYTANTGATGVAFADVAPLTAESGTGTMTATMAASDASTATVLPSDGVTAYPAAVLTATATVTSTAGGVSTDAATAAAQKATDAKIADIATAVTNLSTTVAGLVASLVAQIKDTKAAITATQDALTALAAVVNKIKAKVKA